MNAEAIRKSIHSSNYPDDTIKLLKDYSDNLRQLGTIITPVLNELLPITPDSARIFYTLASIRSYKWVSTLLPTQPPSLLIPCIKRVSQTDDWYEQYTLFMQIGNLLYVPFKLDVLGISELEIYDAIFPFLNSSSAVRQVASWAMARLFFRQKESSELFRTFLFNTCDNQDMNVQFFKCSLLQVVSEVLKVQDAKIAHSYFEDILQLVTSFSTENVLNRKYHIKVKCRLAMLNIKLHTGSDFVEDVVQELLELVGDSEAIMRWSCAKYLARIVHLLVVLTGSDEISADIVSNISSSFDKTTGQNEYLLHGSALALAEICRARSMPNTMADKLRVIVKHALQYEEKRFNAVLGSQVRDSACYLAWAMFKTMPISTDQIKNYLSPLIVSACFDRETTVRRAAAAAIQEGVGRHGFSEGIELVQLVNWSTVKQKNESFLSTATNVSRLGFLSDLQKFCIERGIKHWDANIRQLSGKSCALLGISIDAIRPISCTSELEYHGKWCAMAEICIHTGKSIDLTDTFNVPKELFIGNSKSLLCEAAAYLLSSCPQDTEITRFILDVCLKSENEATRKVAVTAFQSADDELIDYWSSQLLAGYPGYAMALANFGKALGTLLQGMHHAEVHIRVACTDALGMSLANGFTFDVSSVNKIMASLVAALDDYTVDERGDIGSWVRMASIRALRHALPLASVENYLPSLREKLSRIFLERQSIFREPVYHLLDDFKIINIAEIVDPVQDYWHNDLKFFSDAVSLLQNEELIPTLWLGLIQSCGDATESFMSAARTSVCKFLATCENVSIHLHALLSDMELKSNNNKFQCSALITLNALLLSGVLDNSLNEEILENVFHTVQESHYRSSNIFKIIEAINVYASLSSYSVISKKCQRKLLNLVAHPYPRIRMIAAENLYTIGLTVDMNIDTDILIGTDWSIALVDLESDISALRSSFS